MTATYPTPVTYPFNEPGSLGLHDAYRAAQREPGMIRVQLPHGEPAWLATRYADARLVLGDNRFSRAEARTHDAPRMRDGQLDSGILSMDPPEHTRLRTLVAKAFTVRRVEELRPRGRDMAEGLVDDMVAAGPPVDLVDAFALPLPVAVICELLGVPVEDRGRFRVWSDDALSTSRLTAEQFAASREEMRAYMSGLIARHRAEPADDLMTALIEARDERDRLSELELVDLCAGILVAGHETTASQIPNFVLTLLDHPRRLARLREDPSLLAGAVEELMRFVPLGAGAGFPRYATEDVLVGDVLVRAGEPVIVAIGAANRDALRFDDADELRVDRPAAQHLGFGHGVHHCLGAALARMELQEALRVLFTRLPGLHLAGDVEWKSEMLVRGAVTMPVGW
ncbi:MAG: cytochrome P450 [Actinophytocola sp.]|uniref:cytochrome P450 n=1 Tax=Actinophytocola sp. TaxID=1872138 RepID=UPI00132B7C76|nr:cytochrome P450 [Actinophytocola sp.]MPZ82453.1 cytochrome P450 [Actinophytocola sp.]